MTNEELHTRIRLEFDMRVLSQETLDDMANRATKLAGHPIEVVCDMLTGEVTLRPIQPETNQRD
jgi:hypothetical protein